MSTELGIIPGLDAGLCAGIDFQAPEVALRKALSGVQKEWDSQRKDSPQYNMYSNLPLMPAENSLSEVINVVEMAWSFIDYSMLDEWYYWEYGLY